MYFTELIGFLFFKSLSNVCCLLSLHVIRLEGAGCLGTALLFNKDPKNILLNIGYSFQNAVILYLNFVCNVVMKISFGHICKYKADEKELNILRTIKQKQFLIIRIKLLVLL